ncbi:hypothetical protein HRbin20_01141 [bacterium HR20]|nr:hypothetical protein HRbin20_01141 [bacterium HR20]
MLCKRIETDPRVKLRISDGLNVTVFVALTPKIFELKSNAGAGGPLKLPTVYDASVNSNVTGPVTPSR